MSLILRVTAKTEGLEALLPRCEALHRQLRPMLQPEYVPVIKEILAEGAQLALALEGEQVVGLALFRQVRTTFSGKRFYVDDLVTLEAARSKGTGAKLMRWLEAEARATGSEAVELESATHRVRAHRFYLREGFDIIGFSFRKVNGVPSHRAESSEAASQ